jgi:tRNA acetyltransferase TAN1
MEPTVNFDLVITFKGHKDQAAGEELLGMEEVELTLQNHGLSFNLKPSEFYNTVLVELNSDSIEADSLQAAEKLANAPTTVLSKIIPIESVVRTRKNLILKKSLDLSRTKIKSGETFVVRCDLRGRNYIKSNTELIEEVSLTIRENLMVEVNDQNPDWVVQLEVIGENTGISVLKPENLIKKV